MKLLSRTLPMLLLAMTGFFAACDNKEEAPKAPETPAAPVAPVVKDDPNWSKEDGLYAVISTKKGQIVCKLEYSKAPMTVGNFVALTEGSQQMCTTDKKGKRFYDGLNFHRVEPGFVIQGGDPQGNGQGNPGYKFPNEISPELKHDKPGTLAMANSGPNSNGCQFYITLAATPMLNGGYNVFGYVVNGQSVVNSISIGDKMDSVRIVRVGDDATKFDAAKAYTTGYVAAKKKLDDAQAELDKVWDTKVKAKFPTAQKTASGLYYIIEKAGTGATAKKGQTVVAHYTGTLWDGTKFDSSKDRGKPFEFAIGMGQVIPGWDEGFALFKVGSKGKLIIPSRLAYGDRGAGGVIQPGADLIFDVEMLGVK